MTLSQLAALPYKWILAQKTIQRREHASALANLNALAAATKSKSEQTVYLNGFSHYAKRNKAHNEEKTPFQKMEDCRNALAKLDRCGWYRSYHQRLFHEDFLKACTRIFWKTSAPGQFAKDHHKILVHNGWEHLAQEILISTPRRFGKTISVSMFAAALIASCPQVEVSIYSTCKRISQKLLRNIQKFVYLICDQELSTCGLSIIRQNMEEVVLQGSESVQDVRIVNSYPSKVTFFQSSTHLDFLEGGCQSSSLSHSSSSLVTNEDSYSSLSLSSE